MRTDRYASCLIEVQVLDLVEISFSLKKKKTVQNVIIDEIDKFAETRFHRIRQREVGLTVQHGDGLRLTNWEREARLPS